MTIVADRYAFVVGVDTHAAAHVYAIIGCPAGQLLTQESFPNTPAGIARAIAWVRRRTEDSVEVLFSIEGTGSFGAALADTIPAAGYDRCEAPSPARGKDRSKTDRIDAVLAAVSVLRIQVDRLTWPRTSRTGRLLQVLITARELMTGERTRAVNTLTALLRTHLPDIDARTHLTPTQIRAIAAWRVHAGQDETTRVVRAEARRLARRIQELDAQITENTAQLKTRIEQYEPRLLTQPGIGPVSAAIILASWSQNGRIRSADAFGKLAGTCPIPASSGNTKRHRLNRGGDRRLNRAIHTIALTRMRCEPATIAYVAKRVSQGRTLQDTRRILKNYIARDLYRLLNTPT